MGSRFYGSVSGSATSDATRQGTARSGISGHIRSGYLGVQVSGHALEDTDMFDVYITSGSYGNDRSQFAFRVELDEEGRAVISGIGDVVFVAIEALEEEA